MTLSENAQMIIAKRYLVEEQETQWAELSQRVGGAVAEAELPESRGRYKELFADMIDTLKFIPGGRILRNAGRARGSLFNCYHLPIGDSIDEIGDCAANALKLWADGGGVGINFSTLRPVSSPIKTIGGESSGLVSFMRAIDGLAACIESGGSRRAASLGSCDISHPEIENFIDAKLVDGSISYFNISVNITKAFLEAVLANAKWDLNFRGKVFKTVEAQQLWQKILSNMVNVAEPGILVWDNLIKNNSYYFAPVTGTNPCLTGDTLIDTTLGRLPIKDLTKYKRVDTYTRDADGNLTIRPAKFFRTKTKARCITVHTNRGFVKCTLDHRFILPDGTEVEAQNLTPGTALVGLLRRKKNETHVEVRCTGEEFYQDESQFVVNHYFEYASDSSECDIHHLDGDRLNNSILNLQVLPHGYHSMLSNRGHRQWNQTNSKGQFLSKIEHAKKKPTVTPTVDHRPWHVTSVDMTIFHEPVFDGTVEDTHCFFANGVLVHNCGEACLAPYDVCDLGSLVLPNFIDASGRTKWSDLEKTVALAVRFLDNVIDVNKYRLEANKRMAHAGRRIGLGVMGLAEYLFAKEVRYGSPEALRETGDLLKFIRDTAYRASIDLAKEKGAFPAYDKLQYHKASFVRHLPTSIRRDISTHAIRNVTILALAPTGTISLIPEVTGSIEPLFSKAYHRSDRIGDRVYVHPLARKFMAEGKDVPDWLVATPDLKPTDHLDMQALCQRYIDGAVSKTINVPKDFTAEQLSDVLFEYLYEIKGVTVYRDGSRSGQVLNHIPLDEARNYVESAVSVADVESTRCATGACEL